MSKLEKINKALDKFNNFMLPVVGVLLLINAFFLLSPKQSNVKMGRQKQG